MVHQSTHRRRAAMYMIVLATAMLVTVIGLGGLMTARTQFHIGQANNQAMQARFYAQSAIDLGIHELSTDASWRTNLANDTWEADRALDVGLFRWKPVDELDADPIPFPFGRKIFHRHYGFTKWIGEHEGTKYGNIVDRWLLTAIPPGEQLWIRRLQPVPDFFHRLDIETKGLGKCGFGEARGYPHAQTTHG